MTVVVGNDGLIRLDPNLSLTVAFPVITIFWSIVGIAGLFVPCFFWKYKHRLTVQVAIVTTAICCYIFWLFAYLTQLNPLVGPTVEDHAAAHIRRVWSSSEPSEFLDQDVQEKCFPIY